MAWAFGNDDKSRAPVGIKSVTEYTDTIELTEKGSWYKLFMTTAAHIKDNCVVTAHLSQINGVPFAETDVNHYFGLGIISLTQSIDNKLAVRYFVSDSSTQSEQFPVTATVTIRVVEFYG